MIIVTALRTHAAATKTEELVAGRVGMEAAFHFSPEWDGLGKTAVFEAGGVAKDVIVGDDPCIVPHECMIEGAELRVGIYGMSTDGTIVIPTVYALVGTVKKGADPSGDESYPPTPDVGAQAVAAASSAMQAAAAAQEVAAEIQRRADSGEFDGAPGYTPVKGKDYFDGKDGDDYVLTEADKVEIAEIAADLVDVPESGGSADLTGYATEEWVKAGYQPKGNYLTEVPAGYAKTDDIPTKPSDIGAQPAGNYATKSEIPTVPTKLSAFTNDAGFVTEDALENLGGKAYVQNTQPANMEEGEFWYNPDEEPEGDVPSGGGGGERIVADGTKIATGTVPNGAAAWSGGEFGVTVADLKKWKKFRIVANLGSPSCFYIGLPNGKGYIFNNTAWDNQKHFYDLEWIDSDRTILGGYFVAGNAYNNPAAQTHVATGNSDGGSFSPIAASIPLSFKTLDSSKDEMAVRYIINKAQSAEGTWSIFGILRYEEG